MKELERLVIKIPELFFKKYENYDKYFDLAQLCYDILFASWVRFDWDRWENLTHAFKNFVTFYHRRLKYHITNHVKKYNKDQVKLVKYHARLKKEKEEIVFKEVEFEISIEKIAEKVGFEKDDMVELILGTKSIQEVMVKYNASRKEIVKKIKKAKNLIRKEV